MVTFDASMLARVAGRLAPAQACLPGVLRTLSVAALILGCASAPSATPAAAEALVAQIRLAASAGSVTFVATGAFADFGVQEGVRLVRVRIVRQMQLAVEISSGVDVTFAEPPRLCVVGPYAAPDDAGLEDPCWGSPDLGEAVAQRLPTSPEGLPMVKAGQPFELSVMLDRGDQRCDYPAGQWTFEFDGRPLVDGQAPLQSVYAPAARFAVPLPVGEPPLPYLKTDQTRYCGLATIVYQQQGEPATIAP